MQALAYSHIIPMKVKRVCGLMMTLMVGLGS